MVNVYQVPYNKSVPKRRSWTDAELIAAVSAARSTRTVLIALGLVSAGGNYTQIQRRIKELKLDTSHFKGQGWNKGGGATRLAKELNSLLVLGSQVQSFKLKKRLFVEGIKQPLCELCGWAEVSIDGRTPLELDHVNGDHNDNRLENLRILCPNCHSLQPTHRGRNKKMRADGGIGRHATLKMS